MLEKYFYQKHFQSTSSTEKHRCSALFERETKREKILETRQRELKLKERQRSGVGVREPADKQGK